MYTNLLIYLDLEIFMIADKYNLKPQKCHVFENSVPGLVNAFQSGMTVTDVRNIELD